MKKIIFKKWGENVPVEKIFGGGEMSYYAKNRRGEITGYPIVEYNDIIINNTKGRTTGEEQ